MAKPWAHLPGCSGHIHVSLKDASDRNVFALTSEEIRKGGRQNASYEDVRFVSQEGEWFIAGLLDGLTHGE